MPNSVLSNWRQVSEEVAEACRVANRDPSTVTIVGASKYVGPELASHLVAAGCRVLGENRPQQLWEKHEWFTANVIEVDFHFIGHLQRNKAKRTLPLIRCLHSLDSLRLAEAVSQEATSAGLVINSLIDVNVTQDTSKTGVVQSELDALVERVLQLPGIQLRGLMAMSSLDSDRERARQEFSHVRELRDSIATKFSLPAFVELSMGMSNDFAEAIREGATLVRIGSRLWEGATSDDRTA
jgi:PLP dependent protein